MNPTSLPARIAYALTAFVAVGSSAFYAGMWALPKFIQDADQDGYRIFLLSLGFALSAGCSAGLLGLTLPWKRKRRRSGRRHRMLLSSLIVVLLSVSFASQEHQIVIDLLFAAWLAYTLAFTYIRYGVVDSKRVRASTRSGDTADGGEAL